MAAEWIIFEIFINIVEVGTVFYLLCKKFSAKFRTFVPTLLFMAASAFYLSLPLFVSIGLPPVEIILLVTYLTYTLLFRSGNIWKKLFWGVLSYALTMIIAIFSTTVFSLLSEVPISDILAQNSDIRFLLMITARIINIIAFYILALNKKENDLPVINRSLIICFSVPFISVISSIIIYYIMAHNDNIHIPALLIYIIMFSYLLINIIIFVLYETINKETEKNYYIMAKYKQYEITEQHNSEIVKMHSNMREWRHDYANHMLAIMMYLEKSETKDSHIVEAINYIKDLDGQITSFSAIVSTGNYIVDAIVSAKLALAASFDIKFDYNISLPDSLPIADTDICTLLSNLLDNAIEACRKLEEGRYINLGMFIIRHQLHIEITNSTDGGYKKDGGTFKSTKQGRWHGIGMKHIEMIVNEHRGIYNITADEKSFSTQIGIPLN